MYEDLQDIQIKKRENTDNEKKCGQQLFNFSKNRKKYLNQLFFFFSQQHASRKLSILYLKSKLYFITLTRATAIAYTNKLLDFFFHYYFF